MVTDIHKTLQSHFRRPSAEAYTSGVLGVRHTPCETEHDVTFSRSCDQAKITKKLERQLCTFQPEGVRHSRRTPCVLDCSRIRRDLRKLLLHLSPALFQD